MKDVCIDAVRSMVTEENVWSFLARLSVVKLFDVAAGCYQLLQRNTRECFNQEEFVSAPSVVIKKILKLEYLNISEKKLLEYCCNWAKNQAYYRDSMRDLLPHLRLLTLGPGADDFLQSFLTAEEQLHVLQFNIYGTLRNNTPATLNTNTAKRTKLTEHCVTLIPDEAVSKEFEYLFGDDVYNWSKKKCSLLQNSVSLRSKSDIFLTSFELVGSFPTTLDCSTLKFEESSDSFQLQTKISLAPEDFWETRVKFGKQQRSYKDVEIVRSVQTKFGYQKVLKCAQLIPKGVAVDLFISLTNNAVDSARCCQLIKDYDINEALKSKNSSSEIDTMVVKSYIDSRKCMTPYFVKSLGYIKKCEMY